MSRSVLASLCVLFMISCNGKMDKLMDMTEPKRVIVIGQSALEFMIEFNLEDRIVGIAQIDSENEKFETHIEQLPVITRQWPSKESILALKPDLIYAMESAFRAERLGTPVFWEERGIRTCLVNDFSIDKNLSLYKEDLVVSGKVFGKEKEVEKTINGLDEVIREVRNEATRKKNRPKVLFLACVGSSYYYYPPSLCVLDEIVEDCGGEYINLGTQGIILSTEAIIKANPDKIIISNYRYSDANEVKNKLVANKHFRFMTAIRNNEVMAVDYTNAVSGSLELPKLYQSVFSFIHN